MSTPQSWCVFSHAPQTPGSAGQEVAFFPVAMFFFVAQAMQSSVLSLACLLSPKISWLHLLSLLFCPPSCRRPSDFSKRVGYSPGTTGRSGVCTPTSQAIFSFSASTVNSHTRPLSSETAPSPKFARILATTSSLFSLLLLLSGLVFDLKGPPDHRMVPLSCPLARPPALACSWLHR